MEEVWINAEKCIAGRTASVAAKELLKGKKVNIVNAEKAVITGKPEYTIKCYKERFDRGDPYHGPFNPRTADRMLKRMVRGMIPYKKPMGREAYKQLRVYLSIPEGIKPKGFQPAQKVRAEESKITLEQLSRRLK